MNWKAIAAIAFVVATLALGAGLVRDWRIDADFPAIRALSTEADVRRLMGEPKQVQKSCEVYDTSVTPDCDHVFIYRSIFAPMKSRYWLVFFDQKNQVTATSSELEP
jgi:hypothetical protein